MSKTYCTAVLLAAGSGKRMGTEIHKQYLLLGGRPVLYYSLKAFQDSDLIDEIVLVTGRDEISFCREEIVKPCGFSKVSKIIPGGEQRYHSVWCGLREVKEGYVFIHDGARPFVDERIIQRGFEYVSGEHACAAGVPSKDTVKIIDDKGFVETTPNRAKVWMIQTPQVFDADLLKKAYGMLLEEEEKQENPVPVTDDAMVVERYLRQPVRLFPGSYENIKITTPEDMEIAEIFLRKTWNDL